jgi:prophage antirepressor-like protein
MSNLIPFNFESKEIRTVVDNGEVWVVAKDVLLALGYVVEGGISKYIKHVPEKWKGGNRISTPGGTQQIWCLSEQGLYFFLGRSDKPKALPFQMWLAGEVIPSIRKTGRYESEKPTTKRALPQVTALEYVDRITALLPNLGESSKQQLLSNASEIDLGRRLLPLPTISESFCTASELAAEFGVSPNKIGRIATACGLKTQEFGEYQLSKSKYSPRQVEQFFYNEKGRAALALMLVETATEVN